MGAAAVSGKYGLAVGTPAIRSVGPLALGPDGIVFVADNASASIFAVDIEDASSTGRAADVSGIDSLIASFLGCSREDIAIKDMAVHPISRSVILSVMRGAGNAAVPVLLRVAGGEVSEISLENVPFATTTIADAPAENDERQDTRLAAPPEGQDVEFRPGFKLRIAKDNLRTVTVTDMAYVDGTLLVAGASNEEFISTFRRIPFPFNGGAKSASLEIFHVSHGKYETESPIRTFIPYGNDRSVLASYTCTPIVHFSIADLEPGKRVMGRTVAELGSGNTPIDMVSFKQAGEEYLLVSNVRHPLMKLRCSDLEQQEALTQPKEPMGPARENLPHQGVGRMANFDGSHVLMLQRDADGNIDLRAHSVDSL